MDELNTSRCKLTIFFPEVFLCIEDEALPFYDKVKRITIIGHYQFFLKFFPFTREEDEETTVSGIKYLC